MDDVVEGQTNRGPKQDHSVGRHGVGIYGLSPQQLAMVTFNLIFVGVPLFVFLSMMPIWDRVGEVWWVAKINSYIAPTIDAIDYKYRPAALPRFPLKRFLIATTSIIELLVLTNLASMMFRKLRRHALLVWLCFDREKVFLFLFVSGSVLAGIWYVLFYNWHTLQILGSTPRAVGRLVPLGIMVLPSIALLFGHLAVIVLLGLGRSTSKTMRLLLGRKKDRLSECRLLALSVISVLRSSLVALGAKRTSGPDL